MQQPPPKNTPDSPRAAQLVKSALRDAGPALHQAWPTSLDPGENDRRLARPLSGKGGPPPRLTSLQEHLRSGVKRGLRLTYDPVNLSVYCLAFDGAQAGFGAGQVPTSTDPTSYAVINVAASIWAQTFDELWASDVGVDEVQALGILLQSYAVWQGKFPGTVTVPQCTPIVNALIARIAGGETLLASQGIDPPLWGTGGGGGGGWVLNPTATFASHPAMTRGLWTVQPVDSTGGAFGLPLPAAPLVGDVVQIPDWGAVSAVTGVAAQAVSVQGGIVPVQNAHTMVTSGASFNYAFGAASGDGGGSTLNLQCASNGTLAKFWKAWVT